MRIKNFIILTSIAVLSAILVSSASAFVPSAPTNKLSYSAKIMIRSKAYLKPGFNHRYKGVIETHTSWSRGPQNLLVLNSRVVKNTVWIKLRLGERPNSAAAWIPAGRTIVKKNYWRVEVRRNRHLVTVFKRGHKVLRFKAVLGAPSTPTPKGNFAIYEKIPQQPRDGFVGPWALHLTAHSNVLDNYGGGPGRVAIHGRDGASFADPLGTSRSHGCIRINNRRVIYLADRLPLGTPVRIR